MQMEPSHRQMVARRKKEKKVNSQKKKAVTKRKRMKVLERTLEMKKEERKRLMLTMMPSKQLSKRSYRTKKDGPDVISMDVISMEQNQKMQRVQLYQMTHQCSPPCLMMTTKKKTLERMKPAVLWQKRTLRSRKKMQHLCLRQRRPILPQPFIAQVFSLLIMRNMKILFHVFLQRRMYEGRYLDGIIRLWVMHCIWRELSVQQRVIMIGQHCFCMMRFG
mmetsp:Transcript_14195/g.18920  ORF Transcript_14195/g.18920 Transcript_14195/m.18920 type:complete len:219 (-) Transcript_14195:1166-1822(-)